MQEFIVYRIEASIQPAPRAKWVGYVEEFEGGTTQISERAAWEQAYKMLQELEEMYPTWKNSACAVSHATYQTR